jgi:hypothetical protein
MFPDTTILNPTKKVTNEQASEYDFSMAIPFSVVTENSYISH